MVAKLPQNEKGDPVPSQIFPVWPPAIDPLAVVAFSLLGAIIAGELFARFFSLPRITGYSLIGLVCGPAMLGWISARELIGMRLLIDLVLAMLLFEIGIRVNLRWLRHNPLVLVSGLLESLLAFAAVFLVVRHLGYSLETGLVAATIGIATSPAVIMAMTGQIKARGQVTDRLLMLTAINVMLAVLTANAVLGFIHHSYGNDWITAICHPLYQLSGSLLVAYLLAKSFYWLRRGFDPAREQSALMLFVFLALTMALLKALKLPALLAPLLAGIIVKHTDPRPHLWPLHFGSVGGVMVILLFVVIGASLNWRYLQASAAVALLLIVTRSGAKLLGVLLTGKPSGLSLRQSLALGISLAPMSGIAFVLAADIGQIFPALNDELEPVVMGMIFILEILGPILMQRSLRWIGEAQSTRQRWKSGG